MPILKNPCGQNPLALAGREKRARTCTPNTNELRGSEPPHEMSYPTAQRLQYAVTHAQEFASVRPHVPSLKHCNRVFHGTGMLRSCVILHCTKPVAGELTVTAARIECLPRAAPKRRHVLFSQAGSAAVAFAPMRAAAAGLKPSVIAMTKSATSHLLPVFARVDLGFERGEGAWLIATNGERYLDFTSRRRGECAGPCASASGRGAAGAGDKAVAHVEPVQEPGRRAARRAAVRAELCRLRVLLQFRRRSDGMRDQGHAQISRRQGPSRALSHHHLRRRVPRPHAGDAGRDRLRQISRRFRAADGRLRPGAASAISRRSRRRSGRRPPAS